MSENASTQGVPSREKGLQDYLGAIWRRKWLVVLTALLAVAVAVGLDVAKHKTYTASSQVLLTVPGSTSASNSPTAANSNVTPNVPTDIQLVQSAQVRNLVQQKLGVAPGVTVSQVGTTNVVSIAATSDSPEVAAKVANAYANSYIAASRMNYTNSIQGQIIQLQGQINQQQGQINQITQQIAGTPTGSSPSNLNTQLTNLLGQQETLRTELSSLQQSLASAAGGQLVSPASADSVLKHPSFVQDALFALGIGVLIGLGFALLRDYLDDRIRGREELELAAPGLPLVGMIPEISDWRNRRAVFLVELARPRSPAAEAYRSLRTSIQFMALDHPIKLLQITSAAQVEGKTTTSANLSVAMAQAGSRVLLVSCDLRKPRIHEFFALSNSEGLTSVLLGEATLSQAIQPVSEVPNLSLLGSGPVPPNPSELLAGAKARQTFRELADTFDVVLLDSSPLLPVTDGAVLAGLADGVLLVGTANVSTKRDVSRAIELLERVSANVIGLVLNRALAGDAYVYYRYGYGYGYGATAEVSANGETVTDGQGNGRFARGLSRSPRDAR